MTKIKWDDSYSVGIKVIDKQHKHFVGLLNDLYECLELNKTSKIPDIIKDLTSYAENHFKMEEEYFEKFHYVDAEVHKAAHDLMREKVKAFNNRHDDPKALGFDVLYFMEKWLLIHFKSMDKKYVETFKQHGIY